MYRSTALAISFLLATSLHAGAITMQECSVRYKAAQAAGTLNGKTWNAFRKSECAGESQAAAQPAAAAPASAAQAATPAATAVATEGNLVFPKVVDPKYAGEKASKARRLTCADQFRANKAGTGNGGLKWTQKGGGYYSRCNQALNP